MPILQDSTARLAHSDLYAALQQLIQSLYLMHMHII